jgi:hypothetical protein
VRKKEEGKCGSGMTSTCRRGGGGGSNTIVGGLVADTNLNPAEASRVTRQHAHRVRPGADKWPRLGR